MTSAVSFVRGQMVGITTETTMRVGQVESVTPSGQVVLRDGTRFSKDGQRMNGTPEQRQERIERLTDELIARYEAIDPGFAASRRRERQDRLLAKIEWARVPVGAVNRIWDELRAAGVVAPNAAGGGAWEQLVRDDTVLDAVRTVARAVLADRPDLADLFAPLAARRAAIVPALRDARRAASDGPLSRLGDDEATLVYLVDSVLGLGFQPAPQG